MNIIEPLINFNNMSLPTDQEIKAHVSKNRIKEALDALLLIVGTDKERSKEVILLQGFYARIKMLQNTGQINQEYQSISYSQIRYSILSILEHIEEKENQKKLQEELYQKNQKVSQILIKLNKHKRIIRGLLATVLVTTACLGYGYYKEMTYLPVTLCGSGSVKNWFGKNVPHLLNKRFPRIHTLSAPSELGLELLIYSNNDIREKSSSLIAMTSLTLSADAFTKSKQLTPDRKFFSIELAQDPLIGNFCANTNQALNDFLKKKFKGFNTTADEVFLSQEDLITVLNQKDSILVFTTSPKSGTLKEWFSFFKQRDTVKFKKDPLLESRIKHSPTAVFQISDSNKTALCLGADMMELKAKKFASKRFKVLLNNVPFLRPLSLVFYHDFPLESSNKEEKKNELIITNQLLATFLKELLQELNAVPMGDWRIEDDKIKLPNVKENEVTNYYPLNIKKNK